MVNMDKGLVIMTGKSQSRTSTSRTISISLTLQAHPLSRMKKVTCWLSTFHLQPAVQRAPWMAKICTSLLHCYPATTYPEAKLTLLHTAGDPMLHQHESQWICSDRWLRRYLPVKCLRWCLNGLHFRISHTSPPPERRQHMVSSDEFPYCFKRHSEPFRVIETSCSSLLD